jgi:hypothetical protein
MEISDQTFAEFAILLVAGIVVSAGVVVDLFVSRSLCR